MQIIFSSLSCLIFEAVGGDDLVELLADFFDGLDGANLFIPIDQLVHALGKRMIIHGQDLEDLAVDDNVNDRNLRSSQVRVTRLEKFFVKLIN